MRNLQGHWKTPDLHGLVCSQEEREGKTDEEAWLFGQCILAQLTWNQERSGKGQDSGSK